MFLIPSDLAVCRAHARGDAGRGPRRGGQRKVDEGRGGGGRRQALQRGPPRRERWCAHVEGLNDLLALHVGARQVEDGLDVLDVLGDELGEAERALARAAAGAPGDADGGGAGRERRQALDAVVQVERSRLGERREELVRVGRRAGGRRGQVRARWASHGRREVVGRSCVGWRLGRARKAGGRGGSARPKCWLVAAESRRSGCDGRSATVEAAFGSDGAGEAMWL